MELTKEQMLSIKLADTLMEAIVKRAAKYYNDKPHIKCKDTLKEAKRLGHLEVKEIFKSRYRKYYCKVYVERKSNR